MRVSPSERTFVLLNAHLKGAPYLLGSGQKALGLEHLRAGLKSRGIKDEQITMLPAADNFTLDHFYNNRLKDTRTFKADLDATITDPEKTVLAITANTADYMTLAYMMPFFRARYPGLTIVLGGKHFQREKVADSQGKKIYDPVEIALALKENGGLGADAVVDGHMGPFLDFATNHYGAITDFDAPGFFHEESIGREVSRHDRGYYPELSSVPYVVSHTVERNGKQLIDFATDETCPNNCGYCCTNKGKLGFSDQVVDAFFRDIHSGGRIVYAVGANPNAFQGKNSQMLRVMDKIGIGNLMRLPKSISLDPSIVSTPDGMSLFYKILGLGFISFFFGMERVDAPIANRLGVRLNGRNKSQAQLDAESASLKRVITEILPSYKHKVLVPTFGDNAKHLRLTVMMSYILTPFETRETALSNAEEINKFKRLSNDDVVVDVRVSALAPYPGTAIRRQLLYQDLVVTPQDFSTFGSQFCNWDHRLGAPVALLEQLARLRSINCEIRHASPFYVKDEPFDQTFRRLADAVFSGQVGIMDQQAKNALYARWLHF